MTSQNSEKGSISSYLLLPNLFITAILFCGFFSITCSLDGRFINAAICILIAFILDILTHSLINTLNRKDDLSVNYHNYTRLTSFTFAPVILITHSGLQILEQVGIVAGFIYLLFNVARASRTNNFKSTPAASFFHGLPTQASASLVACLVWSQESVQLSADTFAWCCMITVVVLGLLSVSNFRYVSFRKYENELSLMKLVLTALLTLLVAVRPAEVLFVLFLLYILHGPVLSTIDSRGIAIENIIDDNKDADFDNPNLSTDEEKDNE